MAQQYKDNDLKVLLINLKEQEEVVTSFISRSNYSSTVLLDLEGKVSEMYSVYGIPVSYLIDKQGKVAYRFVGSVDWSSPERISLVDDLINE